MNNNELMTIARSLTPAQREILVMLDGKFEPLELNGTYSQALNALKRKGLVHFSTGTKFVRYGTSGPGWNMSRKVFRVRLSVLGSDFIYNGGIDF